MKKGRQDRIAKTLTPACSSLLFFKEKNGISRAEPFPKKREKTMRNEMNIKNMWQKKRIYIMSIQEQTARLYGRYGCAPDFRSWKTRRNPERHWHCHFVRDSFGSYRQVAGGQTGRQYGRLYQTDSENQEKYNTCFCIIFPKKKKNEQYLTVFFH